MTTTVSPRAGSRRWRGGRGSAERSRRKDDAGFYGGLASARLTALDFIAGLQAHVPLRAQLVHALPKFRQDEEIEIVHEDPALAPNIAQLWKGKSATPLPDTVYEVQLKDDLPLKVGDALTSLTRIGSGTVICNTGSNDLFADSDALGTIYLGMTPPGDTKGFLKNFGNRNVAITGNQVDDSYIYAIFVSNADGVKITGNKVGRTFIRGSAFAAGQLFNVKPDSGIFVGMAQNVALEDNFVAKDAVAKTPIAIDRTCNAKTIKSRGNRLD